MWLLICVKYFACHCTVFFVSWQWNPYAVYYALFIGPDRCFIIYEPNLPRVIIVDAPTVIEYVLLQNALCSSGKSTIPVIWRSKLALPKLLFTYLHFHFYAPNWRTFRKYGLWQIMLSTASTMSSKWSSRSLDLPWCWILSLCIVSLITCFIWLAAVYHWYMH